MDHTNEPCRISEIRVLRKHLESVFKENQCQIWAGDFNALCQEDYQDNEWQKIVQIRKENSWEAPKTALTTLVS